jgi:ABC-type microcin C transport system permease subunit YejE
MFKIPLEQRLIMYPFNEFDTIIVNIRDVSKPLILNKQSKNVLSNIAFNYSYTDYGGDFFTFTNYEDIVRIAFFFKNINSSKNRYIKLYNSNTIETNFTDYERTQFDIDMQKMKLFLFKLEKKNNLSMF